MHVRKPTLEKEFVPVHNAFHFPSTLMRVMKCLRAASVMSESKSENGCHWVLCLCERAEAASCETFFFDSEEAVTITRLNL